MIGSSDAPQPCPACGTAHLIGHDNCPDAKPQRYQGAAEPSPCPQLSLETDHPDHPFSVPCANASGGTSWTAYWCPGHGPGAYVWRGGAGAAHGHWERP
jgi:hypothetical protein